MVFNANWRQLLFLVTVIQVNFTADELKQVAIRLQGASVQLCDDLLIFQRDICILKLEIYQIFVIINVDQLSVVE